MMLQSRSFATLDNTETSEELENLLEITLNVAVHLSCYAFCVLD